jgi:hypothetical protein
MLYWDKYIKHEAKIEGKRRKIDNTIYTFDIETTSYLILDGKQVPAIDYLKLNKDERERCEYRTNMYIWMLGIDDVVYYGRYWEELKIFLSEININVPERKIIFVHNLAFEFQFLKSVFHFQEVTARKAHKVMTALMKDYNILFKCTLMMSNCALRELPKMFNLPVRKMDGDLDYNKLRHNETPLTEKELGYCENDCLVVYHYILYELSTYERVDKIPTTSTGHVRRELKELTMNDLGYKRIVRKSINTDPIVYNRLQSCFAGGYTHANWIYTDDVLKDIDSYDETSAYPYVLVTCKFPSTEFRKGNYKKAQELSKRFAYILTVKFTNLKCKYYNNFISASKCNYIKGAKYDNGRIISADEIEIVLTDIDFRFILDSYNCEYEILESWWSLYNYLPKKFINFVLDKYVIKTKYKGVPEKELEYQKEKGKFNALYGMSVTNTIRDNVIYKDEMEEWFEEKLTNDEIVDKLESEKKKAFLSFSYGVWTTSWARDNLLRRVIALDDYVVYCDTDSIKLLPGYDKSIIDEYNKSVEEKIKFVSKILKIPFEKYCPKDRNGKSHMLGVFEYEGCYDEFITQGAKKYAVKEDGEIKITVAGVPKEKGAKALKSLNDFRDNFVFNYEDTGKNLLIYVENQEPFILEDYKGNKLEVKDKSGCSLIPTTYVLGKALDYANLVNDNSSKRARYKE